MKNLLTIIFIAVNGIYVSAQSGYTLNENDSTLKITEPVQLRWLTESSFYFTIQLKEKIKNHVWFLSFNISNNTKEDFSISLSSESHLEPVTQNVIIKSGETQLIKFKMRKEKAYTGFTHMGEINVYSKSKGQDNFDWERKELSGNFGISGEWVY